MIRLFSRYWSLPATLSLIVEGFLLYMTVPFATRHALNRSAKG